MRRRAHEVAVHCLLFGASAVIVMPLLWMALGSLKSLEEFYSGSPLSLPQTLRWQNYVEALSAAPFPLFFLNSVIITSIVVVGRLMASSLASYALACLRFPGRDALFILILSTMMIPYHSVALPAFLVLRRLRWIDTHLALTVPFLADGFSIFLLRQSFLRIPREIFESAKLDGAAHGRVLRSIVLPLSVPSLVTVAILSAVSTWNNYFWPLVFTTSVEVRTLPLGLAMFRAQEGTTDWNLLLAASMIVAAPVLLGFLAAQRYFVQGISTTGLKG